MSRNKLVALLLAFAGGFCAALAIVAGDGITAPELLQAASAGFTTAYAYFKQPVK